MKSVYRVYKYLVVLKNLIFSAVFVVVCKGDKINFRIFIRRFIETPVKNIVGYIHIVVGIGIFLYIFTIVIMVYKKFVYVVTKYIKVFIVRFLVAACIHYKCKITGICGAQAVLCADVQTA